MTIRNESKILSSSIFSSLLFLTVYIHDLSIWAGTAERTQAAAAGRILRTAAGRQLRTAAALAERKQLTRAARRQPAADRIRQVGRR